MESFSANPVKPGSVISKKMAELQAKYPAPYGPLKETPEKTERDDEPQ